MGKTRLRDDEINQKPYARLGMIGAVGHGASTLNAAIGKVTSERHPVRESEPLKPYIATLRGPSRQCVGIYAENGDRAKELLEKQYGKGNILRVRRTDTGGMPRG